MEGDALDKDERESAIGCAGKVAELELGGLRILQGGVLGSDEWTPLASIQEYSHEAMDSVLGLKGQRLPNFKNISETSSLLLLGPNNVQS